MIKSKYRWDLPASDERLTAEMAERLGVSRLAAGVLVARGWSSVELTRDFLEADESQLLDPFLMKGMREAVDRISRAIETGERIRVYGDYDADGVTSTALMSRLLSRLGANFDTYIPHRSREGYGLNVGAIDSANEAGVTLLITVDNGISAIEQIAYAAEKGMDVVVTDHHEPPDNVPEAAIALVNPKQHDCPYPFKGLCGAGVVFKLAHAIFGAPVLEYADLAAIGTVADLMPLQGENRVIARLGLEQLRREPIPGIAALCKVTGVKPEELSSGRIGFGLAPRLNAGGRLEHADGAVKLLTALTEAEADEYAQELDRLNTERQELVELSVAEADDMWRAMNADGVARNVIVLAKEGWNAGVAGLVASKLVERYYRPAIILAADPETGYCKGSARSIDGFDLYAALSEARELMVHFGGHQAAAGLTISRENVAELSDRLHRLAGERLTAEQWQPKKGVDLLCALSDVTVKAIGELGRLEPYGNGNPTPKIVVRDVVVREARAIGKESKHLRLTVEQNGKAMEAIAFGMGDQRERMAPGMRIDVLGEPSVNEWNGNRKAQLVIQDWRSQHLRVVDRRSEADRWKPIARLLIGNETDGGYAIACATDELMREALIRFGESGVPVMTYASSADAGIADAETAASSEPGFVPAGGWRHLILIGLPGDEREAGALTEWLAPERGVESVHVFAGATGADSSDDAGFPDRKRFAEAYALFRSKGSWLDAPDGFLQEAANRTGLPLAVVRMMQEVFVELGFIREDGSKRAMAANPPKKELEQSARYARARRQSEARALDRMTAERLREWLIARRTSQTAR